MMRPGRVAVFAAIAWAGMSGDAVACSVIVPPPRPGETIEMMVDRLELKTQRELRDVASHVYLARVQAQTGRAARFSPVVALKGERPRGLASIASSEACEPTTPVTGEVRIVFANRIGPADLPWRFWRWGEVVVLASRRPDQVRDPELVASMRRAATRIAND